MPMSVLMPSKVTGVKCAAPHNNESPEEEPTMAGEGVHICLDNTHLSELIREAQEHFRTPRITT